MAWEDFRTINRLRLLNRGLQILLAFTLILGLNFLATRHFWREDLSVSRAYSLSPETNAHLAKLAQPVEITVTIPEDSPHTEEKLLFTLTRNLLEEMRHAATLGGEESLVVRYVDVYQDIATARELARKFQAEQANLVIVAANGRHRLLVPTDLMEFRDRTPIAFRGEQALTSAILEVSEQQRPVIYWLQGSGTMRLDDTSPNRGLSEIAREMEARNLDLRPLDLTQQRDVPQDAELLVLAAPRGPLSSPEADALQAYLENQAGRLLVLIEPGQNAGLDDLFLAWGIQSPDLLIVEPDGNFSLRASEILVRHYAQHPLTDLLIANAAPLVGGLWRPVIENLASPLDERRQLTPLLASSPQSWGESRWRDPSGSPRFDSGPDFPGPLTLAILAERRDSGQLGINIPGGKLLVYGSASWIANRHISSFGNQTLWLSTINWMLERDHLLALPPRPLPHYQLSFGEQDFKELAILFLAPPGFLLLIGAFVLIIRRAA